MDKTTKTVMSRKELMDLLNISRTHLVRKLTAKGIKPIETTMNSRKKLYLVSEVEEAFAFKITEDGTTTPESKAEKSFLTDIDDILKD